MTTMVYKRAAIGLLILVIVSLGILSISQPDSANADENQPQEQVNVAQGGATSTPAPVILPSGTATVVPPTETPTRTPTDAGPASVEAKNPDTNVRSGPDINNDRVGIIQPGEQYVVRAKRFEWYRIDFPNAPSGIGWVNKNVVNVIGDENNIPEISEEEVPTIDVAEAAQQETLLAATQTPGGLLTLTAEVFITPQGIFTAAPLIGDQPTLAPGQRLPTFTFPPFSPTPVPLQDLRGGPVNVDGEDPGVVPIVPIAGLAALGLMGLFISILRRF